MWIPFLWAPNRKHCPSYGPGIAGLLHCCSAACTIQLVSIWQPRTDHKHMTLQTSRTKIMVYLLMLNCCGTGLEEIRVAAKECMCFPLQALCWSCCKGSWKWPFMSGISFLLSVFPRLEDNVIPLVGHCNTHNKVKLFSVTGCSLRALVLNHSPCINMANRNPFIPGREDQHGIVGCMWREAAGCL